MATPNEGPFSGLSDVTAVVSAAAKTDINNQVNAVKALIPDTTEGSSPAPSPEFDRFHPSLAVIFIAEMDALVAAINAAPEA